MVDKQRVQQRENQHTIERRGLEDLAREKMRGEKRMYEVSSREERKEADYGGVE